jgi:hypothetical protein
MGCERTHTDRHRHYKHKYCHRRQISQITRIL